MHKNIFGVLFSLIVTTTAFAFPMPHPGMVIPPYPMGFADGYNYEGIIKLSNCSGSIIRFEKSQMTDHAVVLTNGHCNEYGMPKAGTYYANQPSSRNIGVLAPNGQTLGTVNAQRILYSAMTNTDVTLYELQQTYADIKAKFNVLPLLLASQHPQLKMPIQVISGYWKRGYSCSIEAFVPMLSEAGWLMRDSARYSRPGCEIIGGTSGSPVVLQGTRTVVAVNNTINESGGRCTMDNPCEMDATGKIVLAIKGYGYAQEVFQIYSCLNAQNQVDVTVPTCQLFHQGLSQKPGLMHLM